MTSHDITSHGHHMTSHDLTWAHMSSQLHVTPHILV